MSIPLLERLIADAWLHQQRCQGCRDCLVICPVVDETTVAAGGLLRAMEAPEAMTPAERRFAADCTLCGQCVPACPTGARRDVMTHALKFAAFSSSQPAPGRSFPRLWWEGLRRDLAHLRESRRLGRLGPLLDRQPVPRAQRLLWIGAAAARAPELAVSLYDFCGLLAEELELVAGDSYPSGRGWTTGIRSEVESSAARFLEICRETGAYEIICAEDFDAVFFSLVLEHCEPSERPATRVFWLADWLAQRQPRLTWRGECARALFLPATLRDENAKRFPPRFYGDELVRNYARTGVPRTLSDGHTAVDPASPRVESFPSRILSHLRSHARRILVTETFSEAARLKEQAAREGGAKVLLIHEALEATPVAETGTPAAPEEESRLAVEGAPVALPVDAFQLPETVDEFKLDEDDLPPFAQEPPHDPDRN